MEAQACEVWVVTISRSLELRSSFSDWDMVRPRFIAAATSYTTHPTKHTPVSQSSWEEVGRRRGEREKREECAPQGSTD